MLTDVEASTRLFRRIGERYPPLLERHRGILREAWNAHGGFELATGGDAFFVAFPDVAGAVAACADAQRALCAEPWPDDAIIRVRMGVHCGLAAPRDEGYVALAAHQAARVVEAANGGQVVLSSDAARRVDLPTDATLVSLGRFRLRDFDDPLEVFRLDIAGIAPVLTPLRAPPAERHNLLQPLTTLIGRDEELGTLAELTREHRLVSVVGTGGLGKTRLVIEYGLAHASDWQHGVWFADLSRIDQPSGIAAVVAEAIGAPADHDREVWDAVVEHLRHRNAVVLLDNCEHLGEAVALRAAELLGACPAVHVVTTSREPLGLRGERVWRPAPLTEQAAVELFCKLAGITDPDPDTLDAIATLCARVDGLPLAIELAAARADLIEPAHIVAGLDSGMGLGASRDPTLSRRQRTLEDLIAWSYALLTAEEQRLLRCLGVFETGFDLDAATAAFDDGLSPADVAGPLGSLLDKSLVMADTTRGSSRHRLHMTVRDHARRLLDQHHESGTCGARLARHYLSSFGPQIEGTNTEHHIYRRRADEVDNLRRLTTVLHADDPSTALCLAVIVVDSIKLSSRRHALAVGMTLLDALHEPLPERVALLETTSGAASGAGELALADALTEQAVELRARVGEPSWLDGAIDEARAVSALFRSDPDAALAIARAGLATVTTPHGAARLQGTIGCACLELDDLEAAQMAFERELEHYAEPTAWRSVALSNLTDVALRRGDVRRAASLQRSALDIAVEVGHAPTILVAICVGARIAAAGGDWSSSARLAHCALTQQASIGFELFPSERAIVQQLLMDASAYLSHDELGQQRSLGEMMAVEEAVAQTQSLLDTAATPQ